MWKKQNSQTLLMKNGLDVSLKVKYMLTISSNQSTPRYLPKRYESICTYKDLYMNVLTVFVVAKKLKINEMSINRWADKRIVVYPFCGRLKNCPPKTPKSNAWNLWMLPYLGKGSLLLWFSLRILWRKDNPGLSRWALNTTVSDMIRVTRGREDKQKRRRHCDHRGRDCDAVTSKGIETFPTSWKRQGIVSLLEPLEEEWSSWISGF